MGLERKPFVEVHVEDSEFDTYVFEWDGGWQEFVELQLDGYEDGSKKITINMRFLTDKEFKEDYADPYAEDSGK